MKILFLISTLSVILFSCQSNDALKKEFLVEASYYYDSTSVFSISQIRNKPFSTFSPDESIGLGYNQNAVAWVKMELINKDTLSKTICISFPNIHLDTLQMYVQNQPSVLLGDRTDTEFSYIFSHVFKVLIIPKSSKVVYFKIKKQTSYLDFSFQFQTETYLNHKNNYSFFAASFFSGIIFLLLIFNISLFILSKQKTYLFYCLYIFTNSVYILITCGLLRFLLPKSFLYISECRVYTSSLSLVFWFYFIVFFLNLKLKQPAFYTFFIWAIYLLWLLHFLSLFCLPAIDHYVPLRIIFAVSYIEYAIVFTLVIVAAIKHLKIEKNKGLYVLLGFIPHWFWVLSVVFKSFKLIPREINIEWVVYLALYEIFFFGYLMIINYLKVFRDNLNSEKKLLREEKRSIQNIVDAQLHEREQIANIIHDNFGSRLAHILQLIDLKKEADAKENLSSLTEELRHLSHQILPKSIENGALLDVLIANFEQRNRLGLYTIEFQRFDFPEIVPNLWAKDLFLITLELLQNAIKHGKAKHIKIFFYAHPQEYVFQFTDDGLGFDTDTKNFGFGLNTIHRRIFQLKGTIQIFSKPAEGSEIMISLPIK